MSNLKRILSLAVLVSLFWAVVFSSHVSAQRSRTPSQRAGRPRSPAPKTPRTLSPEELATYALPAVGLVVCSDGQSVSQGSGFFVSPGVLVTNYHVIKGMTRGSVRVQIAKQRLDMRIARILDYDESLDLAFLAVPQASS